jgi:hypothetical protein
MFGMSDDEWFRFVSISYFIAASAAAICTVVSIVFGVAQYRISNKISDDKDRALAEYKVQAETKLAAVNHETAVLNKHTAQMEADNLRLKQELAWRELSKQQIEAMVAALKASPPIKVALVSILGDAEGDNYLNQLQDVFRQANLDIDNFTFQSVFTPTVPVGLAVFINPADRGDQAVLQEATILGNALDTAKIANPTTLNYAPVVPRGHVAIVVGAKPSLGKNVQN